MKIEARRISTRVVDALQIESDVEQLYRAAGVDPALPASLSRVLAILSMLQHHGLRQVRYVSANDDGQPPGRLRRERVDGRWLYDIELVVDDLVSRIARQWLLGHEAGEWRVHFLDAAPPESQLCEQLANNWAGALLVPARALRVSWEAWDGAPNALTMAAAMFDVSERIFALRLGEVLDHGVAVVDLRSEPLFGRPYVQRRGWLARLPVNDRTLARLASHQSEARERGWKVLWSAGALRIIARERPDPVLIR